MNELTKGKTRDIANYDPGKGLKTIAVAEAGERHWSRAKNAEKLFKAIATKITAQAEYVVWRDGVVLPPSKRGQGRGGNQISVLKSDLPTADPGALVAHRWRKKFCSHGAIDDAKLAHALNDAHHRCVRICEQQNANTIRGTEGTGEFERYTPAAYVEAARAVLGEIDLDPASCRQAQTVIGAKVFFSIEDNGLAREWHGRVFLNPPYHRELAPQFIDKLIVEIDAGHTTAAILLTNNSTDTQWFQVAAVLSQRICFTTGRIHFTTPANAPVLPTQGQAFFYFGTDPNKFFEVFNPIGFVAKPLRP